VTRENRDLAVQFEAQRGQLRGVAYRMLGSLSEAEDAVQEAWLRLGRADVSAVENLGGWLTTVVARVCLDMLRARRSRREESLDAREDKAGAHGRTTAREGLMSPHGATPGGAADITADAAQEHEMADSIGLALLVVLQTLAPAERIAFVLHDMFDFSFDEIAPIVGRSSTAARQLASRARRRVQGRANVPEADLAGKRKVVDAFLTASRNGDLNALLAVLDPGVVLRADHVPAQIDVGKEVRGAADVAKFFSGRAQAARPALINGVLGVVVAPQGRLLLVLNVTMAGGRIVALDAIADPARLRDLDLAVLND
jgi:RNA polymerase sigma-70 factor (ECF subfamily)